MGNSCPFKWFSSSNNEPSRNNEPNGTEQYLKIHNEQSVWDNLAQLDRYLKNPKNNMSKYLPDQEFPIRWMQTEYEEKFAPTIVKWRQQLKEHLAEHRSPTAQPWAEKIFVREQCFLMQFQWRWNGQGATQQEEIRLETSFNVALYQRELHEPLVQT